jgi:hypothetical protein
MTTPPIPIDIKSISSTKDLLRLAEEVKTTHTPRALTKGDETLAVLMPVNLPISSEEKKCKDEAFDAMLAVLGSWHDLDTDTMIKNIYQAREVGSRPPSKP